MGATAMQDEVRNPKPKRPRRRCERGHEEAQDRSGKSSLTTACSSGVWDVLAVLAGLEKTAVQGPQRKATGYLSVREARPRFFAPGRTAPYRPRGHKGSFCGL